jgi:hypothetical protein
MLWAKNGLRVGRASKSKKNNRPSSAPGNFIDCNAWEMSFFTSLYRGPGLVESEEKRPLRQQDPVCQLEFFSKGNHW